MLFIPKPGYFCSNRFGFGDIVLFLSLIRRVVSIKIAMIRPRAIRVKIESAYTSKPSSWIVRLSMGSVDNPCIIPDMRPISDINNRPSRDMVRTRHSVSTIMLNFVICMNKVVLFTNYIPSKTIFYSFHMQVFQLKILLYHSLKVIRFVHIIW